jgi:hypothetical protein
MLSARMRVKLVLGRDLTDKAGLFKAPAGKFVTRSFEAAKSVDRPTSQGG